MKTAAQPSAITNPLLLPERETPYVLHDVWQKCVYGSREQLVLDLGDSYLQFGVDGDFDTLTCQFQAHPFRARKSYESIQSAKPWRSFLTKQVDWTWVGMNQQGYLDSMLVSFGDLTPAVMLHSIASAIEVFTVVRTERPGGALAKNGRRVAKGK